MKYVELSRDVKTDYFSNLDTDNWYISTMIIFIHDVDIFQF